MAKIKDSILELLSRKIEQWKTYTPPKQNGTGALKINHLSLLHATIFNEGFLARNGGIADAPARCESYNHTGAVVYLGNGQGSGRGLEEVVGMAPRNNTALAFTIDRLMQTAVKAAESDYHILVGLQSTSTEPELLVLKSLPWEYDSRQDLSKKSIRKETYMPLMKNASAIMMNSRKLPYILSSDVMAREYNLVLRLATSDPSLIRTQEHYVQIVLSLKFLDSNSKPVEVTQRIFPKNIANPDRREVEALARLIRRRAESLYHCEMERATRVPVLMDYGAAGTAIHETLAHLASSSFLTEEEEMASGEIHSPQIWRPSAYRRLIAPEQLNVVSKPLSEFNTAYGYSFSFPDFDFEGSPVPTVPLITDGRLVGFIADREGAYRIDSYIRKNLHLPVDTQPGFSRLEVTNGGFGFKDDRVPTARVQCLDFKWKNPDFDTLADLRKGFADYLTRNKIPYGIFIEDASGECNNNGIITLWPYNARRIYASGITVPIKPIELNIAASDFLHGIIAATHERQPSFGRCGYGDSTLFCGEVSPALIVKSMQVSSGNYDGTKPLALASIPKK